MPRLQVIVRCLGAIGLLTVAASVAAAQQMASHYRQAAQAYRDAAAKTSGARQQCFLTWARHYDAVAASYVTGAGAAPAAPRLDPYCPEGSGGAESVAPSTAGPLGSSGIGGPPPAGVGGAIITGLGMLADRVAASGAREQQRIANATAEVERRERNARSNTTPQVDRFVLDADMAQEAGVLRALLNGVNPASRSQYGETALHAAIDGNDPWMARLLIEYRAPVNAEDNYGRTPLIGAVDLGQAQALLLLLRSGANPWHIPFAVGEEDGVIERARKAGYADIERLLQHLRKPDNEIRARLDRLRAVSPDADAINKAAARGDLGALRVLLGRGVDAQSLDEWGFAPLHNAAFRSRDAAVRALVRSLRESNGDGQLPRALDSRNILGQTPLMLAARALGRCNVCTDPGWTTTPEVRTVVALLAGGSSTGSRDIAGLTAADYLRRAMPRGSEVLSSRGYSFLVNALAGQINVLPGYAGEYNRLVDGAASALASGDTRGADTLAMRALDLSIGMPRDDEARAIRQRVSPRSSQATVGAPATTPPTLTRGEMMNRFVASVPDAQTVASLHQVGGSHFVAAATDASRATAARGIFRSLDAGATWQRVLFRDAGTNGHHVLSVPDDDTLIYATLVGLPGGRSGLFMTADNGATWREISRNPGLPAFESSALLQLQVVTIGSTPRMCVSIGGTTSARYCTYDQGESWR